MHHDCWLSHTVIDINFSRRMESLFNTWISYWYYVSIAVETVKYAVGLRTSLVFVFCQVWQGPNKTIVSGQTADIPPAFIEFRWYRWVKMWDAEAGFPHTNEVLYGRWLDPTLDIWPAMTSKLLKQNGQVIYVFTLRRLNRHELNHPDELKVRKTFDENIRKRLGTPVTNEALTKFDPSATITPIKNPL